jgi:class 3 adenylate cyclase/predicted ATPase
MDDFPKWLERLGLGRYAQLFAENDIDASALPHLSDDDLKELGLSLGHRAKLRAALSALSSDGPTGPASSVQREGERRQVCVMFCDLVASTTLATELDPEDYRDLIRAYQRSCAAVVARFDGFIAQFLGDGLMIYFGWPQAHEDDAERAINTGLGIVDAMKSATSPSGAPLSVRIGIATGRVVVGDVIGEGASQEAAIAGEAPNLAARLQSLAAPNTVVIDDATQALTGNLFECVDLGAHALKGFAHPVKVRRVAGTHAIESRFEATRTSSSAPFLGRTEEVDLLERRWQRARSGEGQVVLLCGEPGIGKSRMMSAFRQRLDGQSHAWLRYQCSPYHTNSALYPVIEQLEFAARIQRSDEPNRKLDKLAALLAMSNRAPAAMLSLIAPLLSIPLDDRCTPVNVSPQRQKELTLAALVDQIAGLAQQRPVLFHFEDAHWIDPTSCQLLDLAVARARSLAVLLVVSFRPDFSPPWTSGPHVTLLSLNRLETDACVELAGHVAGEDRLPASIAEEIAARADGVPLFVEELTKAVLESAADRAGRGRLPFTIPASIEASLMARLDHLGPVKEVAQIAAVIGREFRHEVLAAVAMLDEAGLDAALSRLAAAGLIRRRTLADGAAYEFKHALVRDAAYQSLLKRRRQRHHARIAEVLEAQPSEAIKPELLAHHFTEAGRIQHAVDYWLKAAQGAMQRSTHVEAERHLRKAVELLAALPETAPRLRREIAVQNALGVCLMPTRGFGNPEIDAAFARAAELSERNNDIAALFVSLRGRGQYHFASGDLRAAREDSPRVLALAQRIGDHDCLLEAHHLHWSTLLFTGEFGAARQHAEEGIARYQRERDHHLTYRNAGHDPGACARTTGALALAQLGFPERGRERILDALALAEALAHPFSLALTLWSAAGLYQLLRDPSSARASAEEMIRYSSETGLVAMVPLGKGLLGYALTHQGEFAEGVARLREGLNEQRASGTLITVPAGLAALADAFARCGDVDEGLAAVHEALRIADTCGEHFNLPEVHRVKGDLLLHRSRVDRDAAVVAYRQAIAVARSQQARLLELRASTSLAHLWGEDGRREAARALLAPVYGEFTEGFDARDLRDAKALLDELT